MKLGLISLALDVCNDYTYSRTNPQDRGSPEEKPESSSFWETCCFHGIESQSDWMIRSQLELIKKHRQTFKIKFKRNSLENKPFLISIS